MAAVRPAADFLEDPDAPCGTACPSLSLLVLLTDDGRVGDNFRIALNSVRPAVARFAGEAIFVHKRFHPYNFTYEVAPHELEFPVGRLAAG